MGVYTSLTKVKRKLRSARGEKVRFSESIVSIRVYDGTTRNKDPVVDFYPDVSEIVYDDEFDERVSLRFEFTSATEFDVFKNSESEKFSIKIGSGDISSTYDYEISSLLVPPEVWSGTPSAGYVVSLDFRPHLSNYAAEEYIAEAQLIVDTMLLDADLGLQINGDTIFDHSTLPSQIALATTLIAAHNIFADTFQDKVKAEDSSCTSTLKRWKKMAEDLINLYVRVEQKSDGGPVISTFLTSMDKIGIPGVGDGMQGQVESVDQIDASKFTIEDITDGIY